MKKSKGFTLIELLGVIILLGLILAIVVPKISSSIEKAKQNAAADNGLAYVKAARDYYNTNVLNSNFVLKDGKNYIQNIDSYIEISGDKPLSGYLTISEDKIVYAKFCINYYEVIYQNSDISVTGSCTGEDEVIHYTSYVSGATRAYIYVAPGAFNIENNLFFGEPDYALIIYVDALDKVLSTSWGYVFDTVEENTIQTYSIDLDELTEASIIDFDKSHFYILEELSTIYLIETNEYMTSMALPIIDYNDSLATVLANLKNTDFGEHISTDVYKTLEF